MSRQRVGGATVSAATALDFREMSKRNSEFPTQKFIVANGSSFIALELTREQLKNASNLFYMHFRRANRRCYVGITMLPVLQRCGYGFGYGENMLLGRAIMRAAGIGSSIAPEIVVVLPNFADVGRMKHLPQGFIWKGGVNVTSHPCDVFGDRTHHERC